MPGFSPAAAQGSIAGLELKAWALITPSTGAVVKQSGIASVVRNSAGNYTITPNTAFTASHIPEAKYSHGNTSVIGVAYSMGATLTVTTTVAGSSADVGGMLYIAVYG